MMIWGLFAAVKLFLNSSTTFVTNFRSSTLRPLATAWALIGILTGGASYTPKVPNDFFMALMVSSTFLPSELT
jgi:hypothetical protein